MIKVFILLHEEAHLNAMTPIFHLLKQSGKFDPIVFIDQRMEPFGLLQRCRAAGIPVFNDGGDKLRTISELASGVPLLSSPQVRPQIVARIGRVRSRLNAFIVSRVHYSNRIFFQLLRPLIPWYVRTRLYYFLRSVEATQELIDALARIMRANHVCAIVMCEDNVEFNTAEWILAARKISVMSIAIPYTIANSVEFAVPISHDQSLWRTASWLNRLVCWLFPHWKYNHLGIDLIRMPALMILIKELAGTAPANPWILNSGPLDAIATESLVMRRLYERQKLPGWKLIETGSCSDDELFEVKANRNEYRHALLRRHGLSTDRPILLSALPPDQGRVLLSRSEFPDYASLARFWAETLCAMGDWNVIIRPHPKIRREKLAILEGLPVAIDWDETARLVPLCDVYIACVSATIRWAIACGVPTVNYDAYRYGFEDYKGMVGVIGVNTKDEFVNTVRRVTTVPEFRTKLADHQREVAADWACLDGKSGTRIMGLIEKTIRARSSAIVTHNLYAI